MISSTSNQTIKLIRSLRSKKGRDNSGLYFAEGIHLVGAALKTQQKIAYIIVCEELLDSPYGRELISKSEENKISILPVSRTVFESISQKDGPQGIAVVLEKKLSKLEKIEKLSGVWVALDEVQDPGNLGSIMRSLDACGGKGIILVNDTTDPFHPTSVRASMGGIFSQNIIKTTSESFASFKSEEDFTLIGTTCEGGTNYRSYNYPENMVLLSGSEQKGLPQAHLEMCDALVTIPMNGTVDSLNLASATSIILFEIFAQQSG